MPKVFLVTGCSAGLGFELAKAILSAGHKVIATSRHPDQSPTQVAEIQTLGGHWAELDVTSTSLESQFQNLLSTFGGVIDVLINNAGIAFGATVEQTDLNRARHLFETNVFGAVRLIQQIIPIMRAQPSGGTIVNISSSSTLHPVPLISLYAASKSAMDVFTEGLSQELSAFNIRVILAQPGEMRTPFIGRSHSTDLKEEYKGTAAEAVQQFMLSRVGHESVDPAKTAQRIVEAVDKNGLMSGLDGGSGYFRLPLGSDVLRNMQNRQAEGAQMLELFKHVCPSVDIEE